MQASDDLVDLESLNLLKCVFNRNNLNSLHRERYVNHNMPILILFLDKM